MFQQVLVAQELCSRFELRGTELEAEKARAASAESVARANQALDVAQQRLEHLEEVARVASEEARADRLKLQQVERRAEEAEHAVVAIREEVANREARIEALEHEVQHGQEEARREREALVLRISAMEAEAGILQEEVHKARAESDGEVGRREALSMALSETEARLAKANKTVEDLREDATAFHERAAKFVQDSKRDNTEAYILGFYRCRARFEEELPGVDISFLDVADVSARACGAVEEEEENGGGGVARPAPETSAGISDDRATARTEEFMALPAPNVENNAASSSGPSAPSPTVVP